MKASELIKVLQQHPEYEVVFEVFDGKEFKLFKDVSIDDEAGFDETLVLLSNRPKS